MVGSNLALIHLAEWYETVFLLGVVAMFFVNSNPVSYVAALIVVLLAYFLEILIDNVSARVNWKVLLVSTWVVTLVAGGVNLTILVLMHR